VGVRSIAYAKSNREIANFSAFEIDDEVLSNLREYALSNSLYWVRIVLVAATSILTSVAQALAEGHACEQSARRNAMDVRISELCLVGEC
jgi:F0F1-type ATP synthase gamma subunit